MKTFKIIILVAANGAGKGTFGQILSKLDQRFVHIDAGKIVRSEIKNQTEVGKKIQPIYENCQYLDESIDEIIWHMLIKNRLTCALEQNKTVIVDGCLRSNTTFDLLDKFVKTNNLIADTLLVQLVASDATCLERIMGRRVCPKCHANYSVFLVTPKYKECENLDEYDGLEKCEKNSWSEKLDKCNKCGIILEIRKSDTQEFTRERLVHFHEHIEPILDRAKKFYEFVRIDTECGFQELEKKYKNLFM